MARPPATLQLQSKWKTPRIEKEVGMIWLHPLRVVMHQVVNVPKSLNLKTIARPNASSIHHFISQIQERTLEDLKAVWIPWLFLPSNILLPTIILSGAFAARHVFGVSLIVSNMDLLASQTQRKRWLILYAT